MHRLPLCLIALALMLLPVNTHAQTLHDIRQAKKTFEGAWGNKKEKRHLRIFVEKDGYVTINDWVSKYQKQENGDAYKALIKKEKLVMPEDAQHHAPYSELTVKNSKLIYLTRYVDLKGKINLERLIFVKETW